jgi:hypothetical protein
MGATTMTKKAQQEQERQDAIERLRAIFPEGSYVTTLVRHVSQSGMSRAISVFAVEAIDDTPRIYEVSYLVARALDWNLHPSQAGVKVSGAGMDMAFHLVYSLSQALYGAQNGYDLRHNSL